MKLKFEIEYDSKVLGKGWLNIYNLKLCLFSKEHTLKKFIKVKEIKK